MRTLERRTRKPNIGGVANKLISPSFEKWIWPYVQQKDLEELIRTSDDPTQQLGVMDVIFERADLPDSFISDVYMHQRLEIAKKLTIRAMILNKDLANEKQNDKLGISKIKSPEKNQIQKYKIRQKSVKGNEYVRGYRRWSKSEILYLKQNANKKNPEEIKRGLAKISGVERSSSSVKMKMGRVIKEKNKSSKR